MAHMGSLKSSFWAAGVAGGDGTFGHFLVSTFSLSLLASPLLNICQVEKFFNIPNFDILRHFWHRYLQTLKNTKT